MKNQIVKTMGKTAAGLLAVCMLASMSGCQKADNASDAGDNSAGTLGMQGVESSIMENEQTGGRGQWAYICICRLAAQV